MCICGYTMLDVSKNISLPMVYANTRFCVFVAIQYTILCICRSKGTHDRVGAQQNSHLSTLHYQTQDLRISMICGCISPLYPVANHALRVSKKLYIYTSMISFPLVLASCFTFPLFFFWQNITFVFKSSLSFPLVSTKCSSTFLLFSNAGKNNSLSTYAIYTHLSTTCITFLIVIYVFSICAVMKFVSFKMFIYFILLTAISISNANWVMEQPIFICKI